MQGFPYRATLHRTLLYTSRDNLLCYQQITGYYGTAVKKRKIGTAGRVFSCADDKKSGATGITIATGRGFLGYQAPDPELWGKMWRELIRTKDNEEQGPHHRMEVDDVAVVATAPVSLKVAGKETVRYVFYLDVEKNEQDEFPSESAVKAAVENAATTLGDSIATLTEMKLDDGRLFSRAIAASQPDTPLQATNSAPSAIALRKSTIRSCHSSKWILLTSSGISLNRSSSTCRTDTQRHRDHEAHPLPVRA